jgi:hypothetical protein
MSEKHQVGAYPGPKEVSNMSSAELDEHIVGIEAADEAVLSGNNVNDLDPNTDRAAKQLKRVHEDAYRESVHRAESRRTGLENLAGATNREALRKLDPDDTV